MILLGNLSARDHEIYDYLLSNLVSAKSYDVCIKDKCGICGLTRCLSIELTLGPEEDRRFWIGPDCYEKIQLASEIISYVYLLNSSGFNLTSENTFAHHITKGGILGRLCDLITQVIIKFDDLAKNKILEIREKYRKVP